MAAKQVKSKVRPHRFYADGEVPADCKRRCRRCGFDGQTRRPAPPY